MRDPFPSLVLVFSYLRLRYRWSRNRSEPWPTLRPGRIDGSQPRFKRLTNGSRGKLPRRGARCRTARQAPGAECMRQDDLRGGGVLMPPDAIFDLASCSKVAGCTTAVAILYDRKQLAWTLPVKYLPELSDTPGQEEVLIRHLLSHSSGLRAQGGRPPSVRP